ncbi:MAG: regulatory protein RecX [Eubacteriaceae bacterium]|nr:regulatory protein RecX [Eubacteriaceae bacterium]
MDIRDISLNYLTFRNRTVKEMHDYLIKKGFGGDETDREIEALKDLRYLNDMEFCKMYFRSSFAKNRGMKRIKRELINKGVCEFDIEDSAAEYEEENDCDIREDEKKRALDAGRKIMSGIRPDDKSLAKLARRLTTLGYGSDIIYDTVGYFMREKDNE